MFIGRTDAKAETPILWPLHGKSWLIGKDSDAGRDWGQEKGTIEDEMAWWHHRLNGRESEWTLGVGDGQGGLACYDSWAAKSQTWLSDWTEHIFPLCFYDSDLGLDAHTSLTLASARVYRPLFQVVGKRLENRIASLLQSLTVLTSSYSHPSIFLFHKEARWLYVVSRIL